jgi:hypothetical protein
MPSTTRRTPVKSHRASSLGLAAPLQLALFAGACLQAPADSDSDGASTGSSSGDVASTQAPTTGSDDTGPPALAEGRYFLRIDDDPVPPVVLEMDKAKVIEVFGEKALKQIKLLDVDSTPMLINALGEIQKSCGEAWKTSEWVKDVTDADKDGDFKDLILKPFPVHDCSKGTELGKTFGLNWKTSPQFALVRLLTMTPGNAVVVGTSLEDFANISVNDEPLLLSGILSEAMGIGVHDPFISIDKLVPALQTDLLASHPHINPDGQNPTGKLPITLYDAVNDMQPLATELGPIGDHPGILVPDSDGFTTTSDALTPAFLMRATAESNLRLVQGVDASVGAGSMFISTAAAPLAFDFLDPEKVQMLGIADAPTVDMRFSMSEADTNIASCTGDACKANLPATPVGSEHVWSQKSWLLEHIVASAGMATFAERSFKKCFAKFGLTCIAEVAIGSMPNPLGWTVFTLKVEGETAPGTQYLWELLLEVAQIAVHDPDGDGKPDLQEGEARPVYELHKVSIGLTAEQMIAQIRPNLQAQAEFIAKTILGKFWKHNDHLDFYYRRGSDGGAPILFFVAESDLRPDPSDPEQLATYSYAKPGFFADAALTTKLSSTTLDGVPEADHEKLALPTGETTVYMQDDAGDTYALRFYVPPGNDPTEIVVHVRPA